ncbi:MAG: Uma2 family endonuclease [Nitrospinota bacterium]|nr:MAG: Uma2 family endonuclease [Nitrospinota bacterium]
MSVQLARRLFTVEEYHQMARAGILTEDDRVELIEGEIVEMAPLGSRHAACVDRLTQLFVERLGRQAIVRVQSPIRVGEYSEPQPDLTLLRPRSDFYATAHPTPRDVLLVVEVAETSTDYDREIKGPLYARAGIPEIWLVDLSRGIVEIYRQPTVQGYQVVEQRGPNTHLTLAVLPSLTLSVDEILG